MRKRSIWLAALLALVALMRCARRTVEPGAVERRVGQRDGRLDPVPDMGPGHGTELDALTGQAQALRAAQLRPRTTVTVQ